MQCKECETEYGIRPEQDKYNFKRSQYCSMSCSNTSNNRQQADQYQAKLAVLARLKGRLIMAQTLFLYTNRTPI